MAAVFNLIDGKRLITYIGWHDDATPGVVELAVEADVNELLKWTNAAFERVNDGLGFVFVQSLHLHG